MWRAVVTLIRIVVLLGSFPGLCVAGSVPEKQISGIVQDASGAVVVNANVEFRDGVRRISTETDASGQFHLDIAQSRAGSISARAAGFLESETSWHGEQHIQIVLQAGSSGPQVLVSATRINAQLEDSPADSFAFSQEYVARTPALALDDVLKKVPGFTLFRRSSSRTSNPSTQGASMRGLGASGASRALVVVDDIPLIDPFGGWVYWDRVARESISSVEVVRGGGGASLYGTTAMGGVLQFRTRQPEAPSVSMEGSWGNENTPQFSGWAGTRWGPWNGSVSTDLFRTDGYVMVPEDQRGSVDTTANSRHELISLDLGRRFGGHNQIFARGSYLDEFRHNGTAIQTNATQIGDFSTGWNFDSRNVGTLSTRLFGLFESYDQTFSAVAPDRNFESLTNHQRVPSQSLAGNAQWSRPLGRRQTLVAGFEMREVHGSSDEDLFIQAAGNTVPNGHNLSGGRERTARIFAEDIVQRGRLTANLSLGYDHWSDFDARRIHFNADDTFSLAHYSDRSSDAINPRASFLYRLGGTSLVASGYRAFRAPTLNELYRSFRQGNVITNNNPALRAERLTGVEAGGRQKLLSDRLNLSGTFFWNDMSNTVVNVTLSTDPNTGLITRQKQNVGRTLSTGLNLDAEYRVTSNLQIAGGYQYVDSVISAYRPDPNLGSPDITGKWIPQVPHQQFTVQMRYANPRIISATAQGTFSGQQFDDDLNNFRLDRYFSVDVYLSRSLGKGFEAFLAGENIFNTRWAVAATPVTTLGPPVLARVGLRYQVPKR